MKKYTYLLLLFLSSFYEVTLAQKFDQQWLLGYTSDSKRILFDFKDDSLNMGHGFFSLLYFF